MLNYLWAFMIIVGIVYGSITGNVAQISEGALDAAKDAVTLCITMVGVVALWTGLMEIARETGLIAQLTRGIRPFVNWLFPDIPEGHEAKEHITANIIANVLGLGWAATPSGLKAMEALERLNEDRRCGHLPGTVCKKGTASDEMCNFLILNISSLQLIPVNIIAYRSQYGSADPTAVIGPAIAATLFSTLVGIIFCKIVSSK